MIPPLVQQMAHSPTPSAQNRITSKRHVSNVLYSLEVLGIEALAGSSASEPARASIPDGQPECHALKHAEAAILWARSGRLGRRVGRQRGSTVFARSFEVRALTIGVLSRHSHRVGTSARSRHQSLEWYMAGKIMHFIPCHWGDVDRVLAHANSPSTSLHLRHPAFARSPPAA
jgi:hypothetical protein